MVSAASTRCATYLTATVALTFLFLVAVIPGVQADQIKIESGLISGTVVDEQAGVRAYKGIPYAAPPVGDLRWKPPQPAKPWEGVRPCIEYGPACPQTDIMWTMLGEKKPEKLDEDCLYLNVWTPAKSPDDKLPVMVWIHGGGFTLGWSYQRDYDGTALARKGVVLVTTNYRLGPFGFLGHPLLSKESERGVSGNYGYLDQIAALRWVRDNIAAFGGDPDCVTIFGESAGGSSVNFLCVSPLAKGLFHRAISESGGYTYWKMEHLRETSPAGESAEAMGESLAKKLVGDETGDVLAALRAVPAEKLVSFAGIDTEYRFSPAVDGWALPDYPAILYDKSMQHDVPLILGTNADEGTMFAMIIPYKTVEEHLAAVKDEYGEYADEIMALYPADEPGDIRDAFIEHFADTTFIAPTRAMVRAMDKVSSNAYLYQFTRKSPTMPAMGAFHSMEIAYAFDNVDESKVKEVDLKLSDTMSTYWVQFAKTGDPNCNGLPEWPAYKTASDQHLELGDTIQVGSGLHKEACDTLDRIMAARLSKFRSSKQ